VTNEQVHTGAKVRASIEYCEVLNVPFGSIGTIVGRFALHGEEHLTIQWNVPGEKRQITGGVNITRGELAGLYLVEQME
jgi:hypothetical protein